ncbi:hypothetical protein BST61_g7778 [Cercospora zeina]
MSAWPHFTSTIPRTTDGAGNHKVYLNDEIYNEGMNIVVWREAEELRKQGIKIFTQILPDAWELDHLGGPSEVFEKGYQLFAAMIRDKGPDGVDLAHRQ